MYGIRVVRPMPHSKKHEWLQCRVANGTVRGRCWHMWYLQDQCQSKHDVCLAIHNMPGNDSVNVPSISPTYKEQF